jgi:hypothetical protein
MQLHLPKDSNLTSIQIIHTNAEVVDFDGHRSGC